MKSEGSLGANFTFGRQAITFAIKRYKVIITLYNVGGTAINKHSSFRG